MSTSDATIFEGSRISQYPERPDEKWIVTRWRRHGRMIEALESRKATEHDLAAIRARENRPNYEYDKDGQRMFRCRTCAVDFPHSGGIVLDCCPGCGTSPGFIHRSVERNRLATAR